MVDMAGSVVDEEIVEESRDVEADGFCFDEKFGEQGEVLGEKLYDAKHDQRWLPEGQVASWNHH